jgi:hypothetical protein
MKKTAIYITLGALFLSLVFAQPAIASEISGTISTGGNTSDDSGTPSPTPTPTPTPSGGTDDQGHSSEVSGEVGAGSNNGPVIVGFVSNGNDIYTGTTTISGTVTGGSDADTNSNSGGISDEEAAHLAMLQFGPRYGVSNGGSGGYPGAPEAGGSNALSVGSGGGVAANDGLTIDTSDYGTPFAYVPRAGEGPVLPTEGTELAAAGALRGSGLSMTQLILIAVIGLILVGSMGYAISKSNQRRIA